MATDVTPLVDHLLERVASLEYQVGLGKIRERDLRVALIEADEDRCRCEKAEDPEEPGVGGAP